MFNGVYTALVTPFAQKKIDFVTLDAILERQMDAPVHGLVACATTGEAATMSLEEREQVLKAILKKAEGHCPVIAGIGTNETEQTIQLAKKARDLGAKAGLAVTPYYNKPTQEGLYQHFSAIAKAVSPWPIILYNVPSRTGCSLAVETIARLSQVENIVGIKEATGNMTFAAQIKRACDKDFLLISGDDATAFTLYALGGHGVISVASNVIPKEMVQMYEAAQKGDWNTARALHLRFLPLLQGLFIETSPGPVKWVMSHQYDSMKPEMRLPLVEPGEATKEKLLQICNDVELKLA